MKSATAFRVQACRMHQPGQYTRRATCRVRKPGYYARLVSAPFTCSCLHGTVHLHTRKTWEDAEINTSCARRPCSTLQASNLPFPWHFPSCPLASCLFEVVSALLELFTCVCCSLPVDRTHLNQVCLSKCRKQKDFGKNTQRHSSWR